MTIRLQDIIRDKIMHIIYYAEVDMVIFGGGLSSILSGQISLAISHPLPYRIYVCIFICINNNK